MQNLIDPQFWFNVRAVRLSSPFEISFLVLFLLVVVLGLGLRIVRKSRQDKFERELLERATTLCLAVGLLGLVWLFMTFEEIQIFGARFWFLVIGLMTVVSLVNLYRYYKIQVPQLRLLEQSKAEANKYLPRQR